MTVERIHPKAPVMLIFIAIFTCLPSCINLSNIPLVINLKIDDVLEKDFNIHLKNIRKFDICLN